MTQNLNSFRSVVEVETECAAYRSYIRSLTIVPTRKSTAIVAAALQRRANDSKTAQQIKMHELIQFKLYYQRLGKGLKKWIPIKILLQQHGHVTKRSDQR